MTLARSRSTRTVATLLAVLLVASGCDDSTAPVPVRGVALAVATTDTTIGGEQYSIIHANVTNRGDTPVVYRTDCGVHGWFTVRDANGDPLRMRDPSFGEVCPLEPSPLVPLGVAHAGILFGRAWDEQDLPYRPASGEYTVHTRFVYLEQGSDVQHQVDRKTVLPWD